MKYYTFHTDLPKKLICVLPFFIHREMKTAHKKPFFRQNISVENRYFFPLFHSAVSGDLLVSSLAPAAVFKFNHFFFAIFIDFEFSLSEFSSALLFEFVFISKHFDG